MPNGPVANVGQFISAMAILSLGVERIVESLKGIVPGLAESGTGTATGWRRSLVQVVAALVGGLMAYFLGPHTLCSVIPECAEGSASRILWAVLLGFMSSGGAAFWNQLLDILGAFKDTREAIAKQQSAGGQGPPLDTSKPSAALPLNPGSPTGAVGVAPPGTA